MRIFGRHAFAILLKTYLTLALTVLPKITTNKTLTLNPPENNSDANYKIIGNSTSL